MSKYPPPPPPSYNSVTNGPAVVYGQPGFAAPITLFREVPVQCRCPACGASVVTSTYYDTGTLTWVICLVLALMGLWLGCCLIPFCLDSCKDVVHSCPNCKGIIAKYNRLS